MARIELHVAVGLDRIS